MPKLPLLAVAGSFALSLLTACAVTICGGSCALHTVEGSGIEGTQTRDVGAFDKIHVSGSANIAVDVGGPQSLSLRGDDNLLEFVVTEVRGGTLHIGMRSGSYSFQRGLVVQVSVPSLAALSVSGSSDSEVSGLDGGKFTVSISGSGGVRASGRVDQLDAGISGSGDMNLSELQAREVSARISGSGEIDVNALEKLDASISGSGDVRYKGAPAVNSHISGSGSVSKG
jgi:hypothetical protein